MSKGEKIKQQLIEAGIDWEKVNTEMITQYFLVNMLYNSSVRLEHLLGKEFKHELKQRINEVIKTSKIVLSGSDRLLGVKSDEFDFNTEFLEDMFNILLCLDTDDKQLKAISNLKIIAK